MNFSAFSDSPNDLDLIVRKASTGRRAYDRHPLIWFKFQVKRLLQLELLFGWHIIRRPILKEQIYFDRDFLLRMQWIRQIEIDNHAQGLQYFDMGGHLLEPLRDPSAKVEQTFFYDPNLLNPESDFMKSVQRNNPKSKENVTKIGGYQFFYPLRLRSHDYLTDSKPVVHNFVSYPLRAKGQNEILVNGTFAELDKLSYNEHFSNLSTTKIWVARTILDWHWQKEDEMDLFNYKTSFDANKKWKVANLSSEISWYLDSDDYFKHIGRFRRLPENAWLMFLNVKDENGKFYRPYRVINSEAYHQKESDFYAVPKAKVRQFFNLKKGDDEYSEIFKKVETEKQDANEVWLSDKLLGWCY